MCHSKSITFTSFELAIVNGAPLVEAVGSETRGAWLEGFAEALTVFLGERNTRKIMEDGLRAERALFPLAELVPEVRTMTNE